VSAQPGFRLRAELLALGSAQAGGFEAVTVVQCQQRAQRRHRDAGRRRVRHRVEPGTERLARGTREAEVAQPPLVTGI